MSRKGGVSKVGGKVVPPPLVPLPTCHARVKQVQARLFNEVPFPTTYIANCRLCLGSKFGNNSTTIIDEPLVTMMRHVFPFPVTNQIGLPMNVCTSCFQMIQVFHSYSNEVMGNQKKLHETLASAEYLQYQGIANEVLQTPVSVGVNAPANVIEIDSGSEDDESPKEKEQEILIDCELQCETVKDTEEEGPDSLTTPPPPTVHTPTRPGSTATATGIRVSTRNIKSNIKDIVGDIVFIECEESDDNDSDVELTLEPTETPSTRTTRSTSHIRRTSVVEKANTTPDGTKRVGPKPVYICSTCNETFDKHYHLMRHQKTHFMKECPICKRLFKYSVIKEHIIKDHGVLKEVNSQLKNLKHN